MRNISNGKVGYWRHLFIAYVLICISLHSHAQATMTERGFEGQEVYKILDLYNSIQNLTYTVRYTYADSSAPSVILDSTTSTVQLSKGRSFISDSVSEVLLGDKYTIYVNKEDSTVSVNTPGQRNILELPLFDSAFRAANIIDINAKLVNDSTGRLSVVFRPGSYFHSYQLMYNPTNLKIIQVQYYIDSNGIYNIPTDHAICVTIDISGYSTVALDPTIFNESRYIYVLNGQYFLQPAWQLYHLQN